MAGKSVWLGLLWGAVLAILSWPGSALAVPRVVVTIKPIHSLVAGVMAGVGEPALLIQGAGSPHHYSLRPSDARLLAHADLVIRVGADFETFLNRSLVSLAGKARIFSLDRLPGLTLLPARAGGVWEKDDDHDGEAAAAGTNHEEFNLHLWLDPQNARVVAAGLVKELSELDPADAARYRANGAALDRRLVSLDRELAKELAPVAGIPYVVFHDAYPYLERRYHLRAVGSITVNPEREVGARRVAEIRAKIKAIGARCLFSEPQFQSSLVGTLIEGTQTKSGVLDPLGADLPAGPDAYFRIMEDLGHSLRQCLGGAR